MAGGNVAPSPSKFSERRAVPTPKQNAWTTPASKDSTVADADVEVDTEASLRQLSVPSSKKPCCALLTSTIGIIAIIAAVLVLGGSITAVVVTTQIGSINSNADAEESDMLNSGGGTQTTSAPSASPSTSPTVAPTVWTYPLPGTSSGTLKVLWQKYGGEEVEVARSYDGHPWEGLVTSYSSTPLKPVCSGGGCHLLIPRSNEAKFRVETLSPPQLVQAGRSTAARLLNQATFGATRTEMNKIVASHGSTSTPISSTAAKTWVATEMAKPATNVRVYLRERANPRRPTATSDIGQLAPCHAGSRWHKYAFTLLDLGDTLTIAANEVANVYTMRVNGVLRGEVTSFLGATHPTATAHTEYTICEVGSMQKVGGKLKIGPKGDCSSPTEWQNPAIVFTTPNAGTTQVFTAGQAVFQEIPGVPDTLVLNTTTVACTIPYKETLDSFVGYNNVYYKYDPRIRLFTNSVENPMSDKDSYKDSCPSVPRTFLNEAGCVRKKVCAPTTWSTATIELTEANLRKWWTENGRPVHYILGLTLDKSKSPCTWGKHRWKKIPGACASPTALSDADKTTISGLITASTDANPYVRGTGVLYTDIFRLHLWKLGVLYFIKYKTTRKIITPSYSISQLCRSNSIQLTLTRLQKMKMTRRRTLKLAFSVSLDHLRRQKRKYRPRAFQELV